MGCIASATSVCIMIPMDTIKTRLVTQMNYPDLVPYKGIVDAAVRIAKEEGISTFYRGLPPRLISVVPMVGIQFGAYEFMKKVMLTRRDNSNTTKLQKRATCMYIRAFSRSYELYFGVEIMAMMRSYLSKAFLLLSHFCNYSDNIKI